MNDYFNIYFIKCFSSVHQFSAFLSWRAMPCVPLTQMFPSYLKSQNPTYQPYLSSPPSLKQQLCQMCYQRAHISQETRRPSRSKHSDKSRGSIKSDVSRSVSSSRSSRINSKKASSPSGATTHHFIKNSYLWNTELDYWIWKWLLTTVTQNYDVQCSSR